MPAANDAPYGVPGFPSYPERGKNLTRLGLRLAAALLAASASAPIAAGDAEIEPKSLEPRDGARGLAAKYPGDAGIEKDPAVILVENFEDGDLEGWDSKKSHPGTLELIDEPALVHAGKRSLRITWTPGKDDGGYLYKKLAPGREQLYLRFYVYFPEGHGYVHHFVHFQGNNPATPWPMGGAGSRPEGGERFSSGLDLLNDWGRTPAPGRWGFYSYWCEMKRSPDGKYWGNTPEVKEKILARSGRWICAEMMLQLNALGKDDGEQAFWIDGKPGGRWGGYRWRTGKDLLINGVWMLYYVTEGPYRQARVPARTEPQSVLFDSIVVATEPIGPMAPTAGRKRKERRPRSTPRSARPRSGAAAQRRR